MTSWRLETLAVHADLLQQRGDPRGELMALDLNPTPEDRGWRHRRQALLAEWLGEPLAVRAGNLVQHGFIHALRDDRFHPPGLLDSPLGTFVRRYTVRGDEQALARLASRPRPWLVQLTFIPSGPGVQVSDTVRDALIAATPHLQELHLLGARPPFDAFPHPSVRHVSVGQEHLPARRNTLAVPEGVEVRGCPHAEGRRGPWVEDAEVELALDAVHEQPDCGRLQESYDGFFTEAGSLAALLARLRSAGLVTMDGPLVRLTTAGRVQRNLEPLRSPRLPAAQLDFGRWFLWAEARRRTGEHDQVLIGSLRSHLPWLEQCLSRVPLDKRVQDTLVSYRRFLIDTLVPADEHEVRAFDSPDALAEAVETLLELEDLDLGFIHQEDPFAEEALLPLEAALDSTRAPRQALFHLVWGS
ncbi:hypothetical protein FJV41_06425 [Myxococcus llanfairpwllgwyngyllgogerychwyrndrobwllllantysiliogogogochensis]|uniref:Uncharacterized protein n=1 Tax=Myxococcus llanfairpwllgwyngyllgogerychwyrndrobwllllantysiliogogogochensis TaxID=2590453 RepID=A0A540X6A9_9BACT|nr:hypothetical protein [Myxococcus llanfairpwllgwyngyllgogerychwyrndrobwllllantysiliogogogochensis]TQF16787.1 hypothetical protein FJV41_06425 [Myxococcus llanfairpwllgwyngyllgogerychwyrndrobwllllantysiliogogogochensis]